jgi:hypothetical protein
VMPRSKGEISRVDLKRNWPQHVCVASCNVGLPTRYRKKVLLTMGFALCFLGNERTSTSAELSETGGMSVAAVGVFNIFSVHILSLCVAFLALVAVFVYIPFVSDFAFWFMLAAYIGLAGHR